MSPNANQLPNTTSSGASLRTLVEQFRQQLASGQVSSVDAFLASHAHLADNKAAVLDLAYEELCAREEAGDVLDREAFCRRFPRYHSSLRRLIATHDVLRDLPSDTLDASARILPGPGETILGYAIHEDLGRGAFARVYLAAETALGNRKVVIKIARGGGDEAGILGQLDHPNIVPVHSVQKDAAGSSVVCMPYLGRTTLCDVLDGLDPGRLPKRGSLISDTIKTRDRSPGPSDPYLPRCSYVHAVVHLARQLADALAYVHAKGITHRDIKPSNVLIADSGRPMLLDFNLSTAGDPGRSSWGGTLPYMAPEQLAGLASDSSSDVYSLGIVIYELLTGVHPFGPLPLAGTRDNLRELLHERHERGAPDVRQLNPSVQEDLADVLKQCLAIEPGRRPSSFILVHHLGGLLSNRQRFGRWLGRHSFVLGIGAGALALALFVGIVWLSHRPPYGERELSAAREALKLKHYPDAIEHATQALNHAADSRTRVEALLVRAKSHLRINNLPRAATDLDEAEILAPDDGRVLVLRGFCYSLAGNHKAAIGYCEKATGIGFRSAALDNNIGCSYLQLGLLVNARPPLDNAIALDPGLQAAYLNRALVSMRQSLRKPGSNNAGRADIEMAIKLGPESAELYKDAAWIVMVGMNGDTDTVLGYLRKAVELGGDPAAIRNDSMFGTLRGDPRFEEALQATPSGQAALNAGRLLNPLD